MVLLSSVLTTLLVSSHLAHCFPQDADIKENLQNILDEESQHSDDIIISSVASQLNQTLHDKDTCNGCVERLLIGKTLANTRPDLVSPAFMKWCLESKYLSKSNCIMNYDLSTINNSSHGGNFADMLVEINPLAYDGQLYCYFKDSKSCSKPATPNVTVSHMWPPKKPEHMVAPEPGMNGTFNVLHVSDLHIEMDYTVGSETNCTDTICCTPRSRSKLPLNGTSPYNGYWNSFFNSSYNDDFSFNQGSLINVFDNSSVWAPATSFGNYLCDPPEILINSTLNSVVNYADKQNITFDFSLFTGDMVDHDLSQRISLETTLKAEEYILRDLKSRLRSTPVFPVLGNHDTFPYAELAPEKYSYSNKFTWNADLMTDIWEDYEWISPDEAQYSRKHYTGYAVETRLGLKVISLNSNTWYYKNSYCYLNATAPDNFGQFEFLIEELVASEAKNQRVWITAHIPPATDGLPVPANIFAEIVERFSPSTIAGIFFGHTHLDQFEILYASSGNDTKSIQDVINHAFIGPSITPWTGINPSWRYYEVDKTTFSVMNVHNFYTPLNETFTNHGQEPVWEHEYAARGAYNVSWPATSPLNGTFWHMVAEQVRDSINVRQLYENYAKRQSPYVSNCYNTKDCNGDYCFLSTFTVDEYDKCMAALSK